MERKEVLAVCRKYLGKNYYYKKVVDQLQEFTRDIGLTYEQIVKILEYWYDIKKQDPSKAGGGIGIVPHIYKEALEYWDPRDSKKYAKLFRIGGGAFSCSISLYGQTKNIENV